MAAFSIGITTTSFAFLSRPTIRRLRPTRISCVTRDPEGILGPPQTGHIARKEFQRRLEKDSDAREAFERQVIEEKERRRAVRESRVAPDTAEGLIEYFLDTEAREIEFGISRLRPSLNKEFFSHLQFEIGQLRFAVSKTQDIQDRLIELEALQKALQEGTEAYDKLQIDLIKAKQSLTKILSSKNIKETLLEMVETNELNRSLLTILDENIESAQQGDQQPLPIRSVMEELKPSPCNSSPLTPLGFLDRAATVYGDCPSVIYGDTTYTWRQTHRRCLRVASSISSLLGPERGHVVSVLSPNTPAMYELHFAVPFSGAVLNTVNTRLDTRTVSLLLRHSHSKLLFVDHSLLSLALHALSLFPPGTPAPLLVLISDDNAPCPGSPFVATYEEMVESGDPEFKWDLPESEWDPMTLNYTSGTTSSPKGVVHCHRGMFIVTVNSLLDWAVPKQPIYLWTLPMFHANGWSYPYGIAAVGGTNVCVRKFDAPLIYDLIRRHGVTHMCCAPVVLNMLTNIPDVHPLRTPVHIMTAGAPPPAAVLGRAESLGFLVSHGYGLTETAGLVVSCAWKPEWDKFPATERARLKSRQGVRTVAMTRVDVVDPDTGKPVRRDGASLGEVVFRGGCVMLGYLKDPKGTGSCMKDGWFYSGDVAVMHPDGYLEVKDRSKDVIISGGENLSSVEVESVLYTHAAVNEAAVVARPDEFWGEMPCAFVSLKGDVTPRPTEKEIREFCRGKLPSFMVPKTVVFKEELPKTSTGKIQKFVLREMAKALGSTRLRRM